MSKQHFNNLPSKTTMPAPHQRTRQRNRGKISVPKWWTLSLLALGLAQIAPKSPARLITTNQSAVVRLARALA